MFCKLENCKTFDIPTGTERIVIDIDLHVKFFFSDSPIPLPPCFVKVKDCRLTKSLFWKTLQHTSEVFQKTEPQISWMNYSKSDIKKTDDNRNSRQNFCNFPDVALLSVASKPMRICWTYANILFARMTNVKELLQKM